MNLSPVGPITIINANEHTGPRTLNVEKSFIALSHGVFEAVSESWGVIMAT